MVIKLASIPNEIVKFFSIKGNSTLLVKGKPGSGKTIFSLECLIKLAKKGCGIYYSTRVCPETVVSQYPYITDHIPPKNIIDAATTPFPKSQSTYDAIMFSSIPEFLRALYAGLKRVEKEEGAFIVIDSIDSVCETLNVQQEKFLHAFAELARTSSIKAIIVTESPKEVTKLDYLADGVISMTYGYIDGKIYREMKIEKLRAVEIERPIIPFTLYGGRFTLPNEFKFPNPMKLREKISKYVDFLRSSKDTVGEHTTGSPSLDRIMGKIRGGNLILYLIRENVPSGVIAAIMGHHILSFLMRKNGVLLIPPRYGAKKFIISMVKTLVPNKSYLKNFRLISRPMDVNEFLEQYMKCLETLHKISKTVSIMFSIDALENVFGPSEGLKVGTRIIMEARERNDVVFVFAHESSTIRNHIKDMSDRIIEVFYKHGYIFIHGIRHRTPIYNTYYSEDAELPDLQLLQIA